MNKKTKTVSQALCVSLLVQPEFHSYCVLVVTQAAMCQPEQPEGHQLGQLSVAAAHPGPLLPVLAGENPFRAGAAQGSSDHRPADQQAGGTLEGSCP